MKLTLTVGRLFAGLALVLAGVAAAAWLWDDDIDPAALSATQPASTPEQAARGAQLALAGNCASCHTARGGQRYAGGRPIDTPFGTVVAGNLTPDPDTGLGHWTAADFWRALHHGRGKDGRRLLPAFPYTSFTQITREDSDALFAHLRSLPPVQRATTPHALRWPYGTPLAQALWRALYFKPGSTPPDPTQSAEWNRGAYLVRGLGHCAACHGARDLLGGQHAGGAMTGSHLAHGGWYAPSLTDPAEAGVGHWPLDDLVQWLRSGVTAQGTAQGPMAEVVVRSTQHLPEADLRAMAVYLRSLSPSALPAPAPAEAQATPVVDPARRQVGEKLYVDHYASCHGQQGQGAPGIYPALAGSRLVTMDDPGNLLRVITQGGFAPATAANPRPYGMPPFDLGHAELAALTTYLRSAWGHRAAPVSEVQVLTTR